jgi:Suppressor of fused protein (SUFU)
MLNKQLSAQRQAVYEARWGESVSTMEIELLDGKRTIEVHCYEVENTNENVNGGKPFSILITDGLSDTSIIEDMPRTELIWYVQTDEDIYYDWLTFIGIVHLVDKIDLYERTIPIAVSPSNQAPLAPNSLLSSVTFVYPNLAKDQEPFDVDGDETYTLWVLPITENERTYLQNRGDEFGAVVGEMLDKNKHPFVLDRLRKSYI